MSKTTFFELGGNHYKVELVEAKPVICIQNNEQRLFCQVHGLSYVFGVTDYHCNFYESMIGYRLDKAWRSHLIGIAREKGFISGCQVKTATDIDIMKSGRLELIGLSKLATTGRKQIVIYDNGRWLAEAIPEVKRHFWTNNSMLSMKNWEIFNSLTDEEMSQIKCEPKMYGVTEIAPLIQDLTIKIDKDFQFLPITRNQAITIRDILDDYLK